jgi:hypothetical protein
MCLIFNGNIHIKRLTKIALTKKITANEIRDLLDVRCTVFQKVLVYIFFCFRFTDLNEHCFIDRGSRRNRSTNLVT